MGPDPRPSTFGQGPSASALVAFEGFNAVLNAYPSHEGEACIVRRHVPDGWHYGLTWADLPEIIVNCPLQLSVNCEGNKLGKRGLPRLPCHL